MKAHLKNRRKVSIDCVSKLTHGTCLKFFANWANRFCRRRDKTSRILEQSDAVVDHALDVRTLLKLQSLVLAISRIVLD